MFTIEFLTPAELRSIDLASTAPQPGAHGEVATCTSPPGFDPFSIQRMEIYLWGSGAIDNLFFCVSVETGPD